MTAFQIQTFIPQDGRFSVTLPAHLRETDVELSIFAKKKDKQSKFNKEEHLAQINSIQEMLRNFENFPISDEEYLEGINSLCGILTGPPDYSDLREETDREL